MNRAGLIAPLLLMTALIAPASAAPPLLTRMPARLMGVPLPGTPSQPLAHRGPALPAELPANYTVFDVPGAGTAPGQGTQALAINSKSESSGWYIDSSNNSHGFVRASDGTFQTIDADGPLSQAIALWMNDKGAVVGLYLDTNTGINESFLRKPGGGIEAFDALGGSSHGTDVETVNDKGEAVGGYYDANNMLHGFLRAKDGTITTFDAPGAAQTDGFVVNIDGDNSGPYYDSNMAAHGYIRAADGTYTEFDVPGAGMGNLQGTYANGLNKNGWNVGTYIDSGNAMHGFERDPGGTITTFDPPDAGKGAGQGTWTVNLDAHGTATGWYIDASNVHHGFVRAKNGSIKEFDAPGAGMGTLEGTQAFDMNKHHTISGWVQDSSGVFHDYLRGR